MDDFGYMADAGYADDSADIGLTTAVEQTTGNKNSMFRGMGRNVSVPTYQWIIVVGAIVFLWLLYFGLISDLKVG
jgi:hypothetical protein